MAHGGRDDLLVCRAETELASVAVAQPHQLGAVVVPAAGLVPELGGLDCGHHHLLAADGIHLFAHDLLDLVQRTPPQRQERVDASRRLADHAGAQQEPMRGQFSLGRVFFQCRGVELGHLQCDCHRFSLR